MALVQDDALQKIDRNKILTNLADVETTLQKVLQDHIDGQYGYITREWGFFAPGGLGGNLPDKFEPWEKKLEGVKSFFWPIEAYAAMEKKPYGKPDPEVVKDLPPEGEKLAGNIPLHEYLIQPPEIAVVLDPSDYDDYKSAARIFLLLATLSHLCGNSAPDPKTASLPSWIEDPLIDVANRLQIEPTLTGHFVVQENWAWATQNEGSKISSFSMRQSRRVDRAILQTILSDCQVEDRRYRLKVYHNCFVGSQLVDLLMDAEYNLSSRMEAVRLVRRINNKYNLFYHVTGDHPLMDKYLFYRFRKKWRKKILEIQMMNEDSHDREETSEEDQNDADTDDELEESTARLVRPLAFLSRQTSTASGNYLSESAKLQMGSDSPQMSRPRLSNDFSIENLSFRGRSPNIPGRLYSEREEESHTISNESSMNEFMSVIAVMARVPVKDRRYHFKVYKQCFIAKELVDLLMSNECASTRKEAVSLVHSINRRFELCEHVVKDHDFKDEYLFFRFSSVFQTMLDIQSESLGDPSKSLSCITPAESRRMRLVDEVNQSRTIPSHRGPGSESVGSVISDDSSIDISTNGAYKPQKSGVSMVAVPDRQNSQGLDGDEGSSSEEFMTVIALMRKVPVKDRRYRFKVYKQSFIGKELVDLLISNECADTRKEAVSLVTRINDRFQLFEHVLSDHNFKDEHLFYQFTPVFQSFIEGPSDAHSDSSKPLSAAASVKMKARRASFREEAIQRSGSGSDGGASFMGSVSSHDAIMLGAECAEEFRLDSIKMLYPAFGNSHERVNQLVPACMGYALRSLPYLILEILAAMYATLETKMQDEDADEDSLEQSFEALHLVDLLHELASCVSRCKEQFQLMSTDPTKRGFNSKHVSIRQTQPLSNGVRVRRKKGGEPLPAKGVTGTQFPYFHLLDWLLGRHQFGGDSSSGFVAKIAAVDDTFPRPQREYIRALGNLEKASTLRGFLDALGRPPQIVAAYNHLLECYAGEGGLLQAHCRKLYSYIHNDVQFSTSGTRHLSSKGGKPEQEPSRAQDNHLFATMMFKHMRSAADERWRLRVPPLMTEVKKMVYSTSESGGYTTVALDLRGTGLVYEYGDVVKVLLPNDDKTAFTWSLSFANEEERHFKLEDMQTLHKDTGNGWGWSDLWEALGWCRYEENGAPGVPFDVLARYIEQAQIQEDGNTARWINSTLDLCAKKDRRLFAIPPKIELSQVLSLEPVSPRIYSVSGVEAERVFLLVSKPQDGARHHGYERMSDSSTTTVHCSFSPATAFLVPPKHANLVCIASGTGISPFVGLSDAIGMRQGTTTIVHQCKSSELFLCNSQHWLDFTAANPGSCVLGYISGDRSRRNCPMRYMIQNGAFEETTLLGRKSASAYYFECSTLKARVKETYVDGGVNLAYCCGGAKSAIEPFQDFVTNEGMKFEFTVECYGVSATLSDKSAAAQIGGTIVNMDHVSPIHPGGDQILHQIQDIGMEKLEQSNPDSLSARGRSGAVPDHSIAFWECHPHAYNLHRCLRAPLDADSEAFAAFLERQAMSQSVMVSMATKYAEVALGSPNDSKVVRVATELQASALRQQIQSGDSEGAVKSADYLETLLTYVSSKDDDAFRWTQLLQEFKDSRGS